MPKAVKSLRPEETQEGVDFTEIRAAERRTHRHAAETFAIEGEGVVGESAGGRAFAQAAARAAGQEFRFIRVGPKGKRLPEATLRKLAQAMIEPGGGAGSPGMPAGYTYLGQFVDHDLTMDKTDVAFGAGISPADLEQGRSPRLDLDSLYGAGPNDPVSEDFFQADGIKLRVGRTDDDRPFDLPRRSGGALRIPDHRNDENLAVGQTHLAFIRFHNAVVDELSSVPPAKRFARARRAVVKHYQWMLRTDYLPRICRASIVDDVFANGRRLVQPNADPRTMPKMPVEFSVAAFRLGHSQIRATYSWNRNFPGATLDDLFTFSGTSGGMTRLPGIWIADWRRLYELPGAALQPPAGTANRAMRIDTRLVDPLAALRDGSIGGPPGAQVDRNLAFRNLVRARMVRLASGQDMVAKLRAGGLNVTPLTRSQILEGAGGADLGGLTNAQRSAIAEDTPLWFYVLREAELNGGVLRGVGARIVAETFHRAMEGSGASIVRDTDFKPHFAADEQTFGMPELLMFAFDGDVAKLNPEG